MRFKVRASLNYQFAGPCEVLLLLEAATGDDQRVSGESLIISSNPMITRIDDPQGGERRAVFVAQDWVQVDYSAEIAVAERDTLLKGASAVPVAQLPPEVLRHLRPSRYCPSDRFERFVNRQFGDSVGGDRVDAILDWIAENIDYVSAVSDGGTTALDTFVDRAGVCRDFTHLAISLCRASQIPARAVSGYGWRLQPPDMHAVLEVFVGGAWRLADPTRKVLPREFVRVATGRDAADIAFMTIFGTAQLVEQSFDIALI